MVVLAGENLESGLVFLVGDAEKDSGAKHELRAFQKVEHNVFQLRLHCLLVNQVEVDLIFRCDLNSYVALDEVDLTSERQAVILCPLSLASLNIHFNFVEDHVQ